MTRKASFYRSQRYQKWQTGRSRWGYRRHSARSLRWGSRRQRRSQKHQPDATTSVSNYELPEYLTAIYIKLPQIKPTVGKRLRLELEFIIFLRDEGYHHPHFIRDDAASAAITTRIDMVKPAAAQGKLPANQRRSLITVSYDFHTFKTSIMNTPDLRYDLPSIGTELVSYLLCNHLQILYDPQEIFPEYRGIARYSLATKNSYAGSKTSFLYMPPSCQNGNNIMYENEKSEQAQISFEASASPCINELITLSERLGNDAHDNQAPDDQTTESSDQATEPIFVRYTFQKYAYNLRGELIADFGQASQTFNIVIKLAGVHQDETTHNCVIYGVIHQVIAAGKNLSSYRPTNEVDDDTSLLMPGSFIKVQHWRTEDPNQTERASVCHILNEYVAKWGAFPYVPIPKAAWTNGIKYTERPDP